MFHVKHRGIGRGGIPLPPYPPLRIPSLTPYLCCLHIHRHGFFPLSFKKIPEKFSTLSKLTLYICNPLSFKKIPEKFFNFSKYPPLFLTMAVSKKIPEKIFRKFETSLCYNFIIFSNTTHRVFSCGRTRVPFGIF